jgi:hypothetical protein
MDVSLGTLFGLSAGGIENLTLNPDRGLQGRFRLMSGCHSMRDFPLDDKEKLLARSVD